MNRIIKFRSWDEGRKLMIGVDYPENWNDERDEWYADTNLMELTGITEISKEMPTMQYTGLLDRNGKEIYEGDVVKSFTYPQTGLVEKIEINKVVEYKIGKIWQGYQIDENDEVIGNIYEHPELTEKGA